MQSVFSTKDNSGECSDFEVEVDKNNIMWSKVRCQNNTPEDSSWIEISLISGDEQDDKDDQQQPSVEHDTKKPSNDVDRYTTMNGGQTLDSNRKGEGENLVDGHSDTMTNSDKCNVIEYGTWLASASLKSVVDGDDLSAADNSSKVEVPKTVATARPREVKSKPLLKSRRKTPVVNLGSLNGSHGTNSQEVPQLKRRQIKHVNLEEHFVVSGFKLSKRDNSSTRVTKGRMTANLKSSLSSQHLDQVTETIPSSRLQPDDAAAAADKIKPESPATANNGYVPNLSGDGEGEQQEIKQVDVQKKRRVVRRKSRNAWQKGKLRTKGRLILKRRNKCASNPPLKQTCVTEITTVVSEPCGDDDSVTPTLEALRVSVTDTRSVTADCKAIDLRSNEVSVMDTVDESALDTLVSSKEDSHSHPDSEVVKSGPGRNRRLKRDLKCFVEYIAKNGLVSRRTSRTCNKTIKAEPVKLWQKNKVEASLRSKQKNNLELHRNTKSPSKTSPSCTTGSSSSTTSHMQLVNPSKLKRKLEEKNEAPVKNVKRRQTVDVVTISNSPKLEKKIQKVQQKGQNGSNDKVKGTVKKTLVSKAQLQNVVKKSKKVPGKIQRRISGSEVAVKQKSVKTKGTVHSLVSQKKKAIRMQLALEKKKKNETKQKKVLASKENNDHAVELVSVKRVYRNSTTAKGVRSSAPIARSCTVALHSLKSAGYTIEGTKKYHLSSELDLRDNSPKALCVSPGHLQLHRLAAIFPSVRPLSLDGQKQSLSCTHPLPQPKRTSKNGSQLQRKSRLSKKGSWSETDSCSHSMSIKLKSLPQVVLTQLPLGENPTRSSIRQTECAFRYREIAIKKQENFIQIVLMSNTRVKNGLNCQVMYELQMALTAAKADSKCRLVVINGTGSVFCSGVDLISLSTDHGQAMAEKMANAIRDFCKTLLTFPKPLVAAVNGAAVGLGVTFLPYFDLVYASDKATFYTPYGKLGQIPEGGATFTLPSILGYARANGLLLEGRRLTATEAHEFGLVTQVLWPSLFMEEVIPRVRSMASRPLQAMESTKALVRYHAQSKLEVTLDTECRVLVQQWSSRECRLAIQQFLQHEEVV